MINIEIRKNSSILQDIERQLKKREKVRVETWKHFLNLKWCIREPAVERISITSDRFFRPKLKTTFTVTRGRKKENKWESYFFMIIQHYWCAKSISANNCRSLKLFCFLFYPCVKEKLCPIASPSSSGIRSCGWMENIKNWTLFSLSFFILVQSIRSTTKCFSWNPLVFWVNMPKGIKLIRVYLTGSIEEPVRRRIPDRKAKLDVRDKINRAISSGDEENSNLDPSWKPRDDVRYSLHDFIRWISNYRT